MIELQDYFILNPWWENKKFKTGISRPLYLQKLEKELDRKQIELIVGARRVGKTTIMKQLIEVLLKDKIDKNSIFYVSCDFAKFIGVGILEHLANFRQLFSYKRDKKLYLFFDEVQESPKWQIELKSLYDSENIKIICSGSTSALLESHGGKLTGRQISTIINPLTFKEFLEFNNFKPKISESYLILKELEKYLRIGGFPENVLMPSEEYLSALLDDIFLRDIVRLYPVKNLTLIKDLFKFLASSVGSRTSYHKIANLLGISLETVRDYIDHLETAFLLKKMNKWTSSYADRTYAGKKIYLADTGLKTLLTGKGDLGAKAENLVFEKLYLQKKRLGYFAVSEKEVDFVLGEVENPSIYEVKYTEEIDKINKSLISIKLFLSQYPKTEDITIITKNIRKTILLEKRKIKLIPLWQFLLQ